MENLQDTAIALKAEIAELQDEVNRLAVERRRLASSDNVYVLDDDDDEARAFDAFYRAYDEGHAKTRKFLLD